MKRPRTQSRPNVLPANFTPYIEGFIDRKVKGYTAGQKRLKHTVIDICDHCRKPVRIRRSFLKLLKKGWKFYHLACYRQAHPTGNCKENKAIVGYTTFNK